MKQAFCIVTWAVMVFGVTVNGGCRGAQSRDAAADGAGSSNQPPPPVLRGTVHTGQSDDGAYRLQYVTDPDPLPLNEMFSMEVVVERVATAGAAWEPVSLSVDARMPEHQHGMNVEPRVEPLGEGRFRVTRMLFHMPGYWELYFDIVSRGVTTRIQFEMTLD